jgi:hypothetical protein
MKVIFRTSAPRFCAGVLSLLVFFAGESIGAETIKAPVPIRIGWQIPTAMQALITQILKRTNLLESHGLEPSLVPFSFGRRKSLDTHGRRVALVVENELRRFEKRDAMMEGAPVQR